jgi:hydroxymethylpyrimidine pyrophosphatase-like HAD family hydrolase
MRYLALACDYDGTIAPDGRVAPEVLAALERVRGSGRRLILVTGRILADLQGVFPGLAIFDRVVAENGAVLYDPASQHQTILAEPPPDAFEAALRERGVAPLARGAVIMATWRPQEGVVLDAIRDLGLELHVIFNNEAVMVLPSGVNKATGLAHALRELGLSAHNTVGVGDAENDHAFLAACECAVAVANALPALQERSDWVTSRPSGEGVMELVEALLASDLKALAPRLARHQIAIGTALDGTPLYVPPYGENLLVAGTSGSGKSTFATAFLEALAERGYQFCIIDPEGDYDEPALAPALGDGSRPPQVDEVLKLLQAPDQSLAVNLIGLPMADRPGFFARLLPQLEHLRARTGRPHWVLVDETHHLLPEPQERTDPVLPPDVTGLLYVTVHPEHVSQDVLRTVQQIVVIGGTPQATLRNFAERLGLVPPAVAEEPLPPGEAIAWRPFSGAQPRRFRSAAPQTERHRHIRKYAEGELPPERSFYFQGPEGRLNLRAQNLQIFIQIASGVDDGTWLHHLRNGDYVRWFRQAIKDPELAEAVSQIPSGLPPAESRDRVRALIEERYTAPA